MSYDIQDDVTGRMKLSLSLHITWFITIYVVKNVTRMQLYIIKTAISSLKELLDHKDTPFSHVSFRRTAWYIKGHTRL